MANSTTKGRSRGAGSHRTPERRLQDQAFMWRELAQNPRITQRELAERLGISRQMISVDYRQVKAEMKARIGQSHDKWRDEILNRLDKQMDEAWIEWERSKGDRKTTTQNAETITPQMVSGPQQRIQSIRTRIEGRLGDVRYLDTISISK
jgi:DNA-binding transcriptional MocR family regulator